ARMHGVGVGAGRAGRAGRSGHLDGERGRHRRHGVLVRQARRQRARCDPMDRAADEELPVIRFISPPLCSAALALACAACVDPPRPASDEHRLGSCGTVRTFPIVDSPHVAPGTAIAWATNPPTSGPHYPVWAAWDRIYTDLERGFWLHNAEHGAIVLVYRC